MLQEAHANLGNKWAQITRQLNTGRPENAIKNRWNTRNKKTTALKVLGASKHEVRHTDPDQPRRAYPEHPFVHPGGGGSEDNDKPHGICQTTADGTCPGDRPTRTTSPEAEAMNTSGDDTPIVVIDNEVMCEDCKTWWVELDLPGTT